MDYDKNVDSSKDNNEFLELIFIQNHVITFDWAIFISMNYKHIFERFKTVQIPRVAASLGYVLIKAIDMELDVELKYNFPESLMKISRIGLHSMCVVNEGGFIAIEHAYNQNYSAYLYYLHFCSLSAMGRPIAARRYLINTKQLIKVYIDRNKDKKDKDSDAEHWSDFLEYCDLIEVSNNLQYLYDMPRDEQRLYLFFEYQILITLKNNFSERNIKRYGIKVDGLLNKIRCDLLKYKSFTEEEINHYKQSSKLKGFDEWCFHNALCLNLLNEIPLECADLLYNQKISFYKPSSYLIFDDVVRSFNHCKSFEYSFQLLGPQRFNKSRDEEIEKLIDCYYRLYSILDKIANILVNEFLIKCEKKIYLSSIIC